MDGACCTRADLGSIFLKRGGGGGGHACKMEKSNTSPRPELEKKCLGGGGGGGGGGDAVYIATFYSFARSLLSALYCHGYSNLVQVLGGRSPLPPPPLTTALMSAVLCPMAPHQRDALCFCYLSDCSFSIKKQLMRS